MHVNVHNFRKAVDAWIEPLTLPTRSRRSPKQFLKHVVYGQTKKAIILLIRKVIHRFLEIRLWERTVGHFENIYNAHS